MSDRIFTTTIPDSSDGRLSAQQPVIQQAVSVLMDWYDLPPLEAEAELGRWAIQCEVSTYRVAEALVRGVCLGQATSFHATLLRQLEQLLRSLPAH